MHQDVLDSIQHALGDAFHSLYLVGSYGTEVALDDSDVDYVCVTRHPLEDKELARLFNARNRLRHEIYQHIDIRPVAYARIIKQGLGVKREGRLVGGQDIRSVIEEPSKVNRDKWLVEVAMVFLEKIHRCKITLDSTVSYPDEEDEFMGYCKEWADESIHKGQPN